MSAVKYIITLTHGNFHGVIKLNMLPKVNLLDFNFGGFLLSKFSVIKYMKPYLKINIDLYFSAHELHGFSSFPNLNSVNIYSLSGRAVLTGMEATGRQHHCVDL